AAAAIGRHDRRSRLKRVFLALVFGLALATLGAELALRVFGSREAALAGDIHRTDRRSLALSRARIARELDDPVRRYGLRPGVALELDGWTFRVSSQGTRGPEVPSPKPAGEKRLLMLGDSFAFGLWCDEDETVAAQLVARANAREQELSSGITWRALELGVAGYHLGQSRRALEQDGLALAPDLVVLYMNTNDLEQTGFFYDEALGVLRRDYLPLPDALRMHLWRWSHLYGWIASAHARAVQDVDKPHLDPRVPSAHTRADNQAYARAELARIAALCRARELPLFVINQPLMTLLSDSRRADWPTLALDAWTRRTLEELQLPALHLLGWVRGHADGVDRFDQGVPPDQLTDQFIADERVQAALAYARAQAAAAGRDFDALSYAEQLTHFAGYTEPLPSELDYHLTGAGYASIARLAYARLAAEGLLP
ncbi:MAG: hypothetical protein ABL998_24080, partial [Planctomycetota bacterium]